MTTQTRGATAPLAADLHGHARRWAVAVSATGLALLVLTILWSVLTPWGQRLDQRALSAVATTEAFRAERIPTVLRAVEVPTLTVALGICVVLALVRRRVDLGVAAAVVVLGANLTTYVVRTYLVTRPDHGIGELGPVSSAPSGHATAAVSIALAIVLVTPMTLRFYVTFLASVWATWAALGVVVVRMNYPGDVLSALAVGALWAGIGLAVAAVLAGRPALRRALREFRRQVRGLGWTRPQEASVSAAPYGLTLLILAGMSATVVMGVLLVAWGVGVEASLVGMPLGLGTLALVGSLAGLLVGATSRAVEKYLG